VVQHVAAQQSASADGARTPPLNRDFRRRLGALLNQVISVGPIVLGLGLLLAGVCIVIRLLSPGPKVGASVPGFLLRALAVGAATFIAGAVAGVAVFCSSASSGNLCGLGGIFGTGPLLCGVSVGWYAVVWLKRSRHTVPSAH